MSKILKNYLTNANAQSLLQSYNTKHNTDFSFPSDEIKNQVLGQIHTGFIIQMLLPYLGCNPIDVGILGRGTQGYVISLTSKNMNEKIDSMSNMFVIEREKKSSRHVPDTVAAKIQLLYTKNKFWEERILKEEYILDKVRNIKDVKENVPNFYYGCTFNFNRIRLRITFMDIVDPTIYSTITRIIDYRKSISEELYNNIKQAVELLWKHGITHNDLSTNNILVNVINNKDFRIIDFGLAELILPDRITNSQTYSKYFSNLSKEAQNGSNVSKLKDLLSYVKV